MGATKSKSEIVNEIVNNTAINVMAEISTSAKSSTKQSNSIVISNISNTTISDVRLNNISKISVSAVAESAISGELQSKLSSAIAQQISQQASTIGYTNSDSNVKNLVQNIINTNISSKSVNESFSGVEQENKLVINNIQGSRISDIYAENMATAVATLMSSSSTQIAAGLGLESTSDTQTKQTTSNPVSDAFKEIGATIQGVVSSFADLLGGQGFIALIFLLAAGIGFYFFRQELIDVFYEYQPYSYGVVGGVGLLLILLLIF